MHIVSISMDGRYKSSNNRKLEVAYKQIFGSVLKCKERARLIKQFQLIVIPMM